MVAGVILVARSVIVPVVLGGNRWRRQPRDCADRCRRGPALNSGRFRVVAFAVFASAAVLLCLAWVGEADAAGWRFPLVPKPAGSRNMSFYGVSCTSGTACTAVGGPDSGYGAMLVERWNGSRWRIEHAAKPAGSKDTGLTSVSCTSRTTCTAVGYFDQASSRPVYPLVERWNGSHWSVSRTPLQDIPPHGSVLNGVSCTSSAACTAVGYTSDAIGNALPLVERWNGSQWSGQPAAIQPLGGRGGQLIGVSCTSTTACTAVGDLRNGLAENWNGMTWSVKAANNNFMVDYGAGALNAVSCTSPTACAAVGSAFFEGLGDSALEEFWNGVAWSFQRDNSLLSSLSGVSCTSVTNCVAVGDGVERWNGKTWSIQTRLLVGFVAVSCVSANVCMAVGSDGFPADGTEVPSAARYS